MCPISSQILISERGKQENQIRKRVEDANAAGFKDE